MLGLYQLELVVTMVNYVQLIAFTEPAVHNYVSVQPESLQGETRSVRPVSLLLETLEILCQQVVMKWRRDCAFCVHEMAIFSSVQKPPYAFVHHHLTLS